MTRQFVLMVREYTAQQLILLAIRVAPPMFAHKIVLAMLAMNFIPEDFQ